MFGLESPKVIAEAVYDAKSLHAPLAVGAVLCLVAGWYSVPLGRHIVNKISDRKNKTAPSNR